MNQEVSLLLVVIIALMILIPVMSPVQNLTIMYILAGMAVVEEVKSMRSISSVNTVTRLVCVFVWPVIVVFAFVNRPAYNKFEKPDTGEKVKGPE